MSTLLARRGSERIGGLSVRVRDGAAMVGRRRKRGRWRAHSTLYWGAKVFIPCPPKIGTKN